MYSIGIPFHKYMTAFLAFPHAVWCDVMHCFRRYSLVLSEPHIILSNCSLQTLSAVLQMFFLNTQLKLSPLIPILIHARVNFYGWRKSMSISMRLDTVLRLHYPKKIQKSDTIGEDCECLLWGSILIPLYDTGIESIQLISCMNVCGETLNLQC